MMFRHRMAAVGGGRGEREFRKFGKFRKCFNMIKIAHKAEHWTRQSSSSTWNENLVYRWQNSFSALNSRNSDIWLRSCELWKAYDGITHSLYLITLKNPWRGEVKASRVSEREWKTIIWRDENGYFLRSSSFPFARLSLSSLSIFYGFSSLCVAHSTFTRHEAFLAHIRSHHFK